MDSFLGTLLKIVTIVALTAHLFGQANAILNKQCPGKNDEIPLPENVIFLHRLTDLTPIHLTTTDCQNFCKKNDDKLLKEAPKGNVHCCYHSVIRKKNEESLEFETRCSLTSYELKGLLDNKDPTDLDAQGVLIDPPQLSLDASTYNASVKKITKDEIKRKTGIIVRIEKLEAEKKVIEIKIAESGESLDEVNKNIEKLKEDFKNANLYFTQYRISKDQNMMKYDDKRKFLLLKTMQNSKKKQVRLEELQTKKETEIEVESLNELEKQIKILETEDRMSKEKTATLLSELEKEEEQEYKDFKEEIQTHSEDQKQRTNSFNKLRIDLKTNEKEVEKLIKFRDKVNENIAELKKEIAKFEDYEDMRN